MKKFLEDLENKMFNSIKIIYLVLFSFLLAGCGSSTSSNNSSEDLIKYKPTYIESITNDTVINQNISKVKYKNSFVDMLVILVNYKNIKISSTDKIWSDKLFGNKKHQLNHYYNEVSNSKFQFHKAKENYNFINDGVVSVSLDKNHPNTDVDSNLFQTNTYPDLKNALIKADDYIDFSNYDFNADGFITPNELIITFIIAGYEDSFEGRHVTNGVWGHQSCTKEINTPMLDGIRVMGCQNGGNFALFGEKHNINNPHNATIGIIAHELAHSTFSLPDLYNTAGYDSGIGILGLMGGGVWNQENRDDNFGNTPAHFTAWTKVYLGWVTPIVASGSTSLYETSSSDYNIIKIPISANHYYLLENRNNSGYDKGLYSLSGNFNGGIAIWHINQNKLTVDNFSQNNINNDKNDKGVDLVEASVSNIDIGGKGDENILFYSPNISSFGNKVTNISNRGSVMNLIIN